MLRTIKAEHLARVEGAGAYYVTLKDNQVIDAKFRIWEPPRFFESFLKGRDCADAPDFTSRICGICPIAYQMSAVHAIEDAFNTEIQESVRVARRISYCGEWIESHGLHLYMLHAPDFFKCDDAFSLAERFPDEIKRGLSVKRIGNELLIEIGGREIHPINNRIGGYYKSPSKAGLQAFIERLKWARDASIATVKWVSQFQFPDFERDYEFVSLRAENEYPMNGGRIVSNKGLNIAIRDFDSNFSEEQVIHSNALQSHRSNGSVYFMGPLARFNLNFDKLSRLAKEVARSINFLPPVRNPFKSIIARGIEILYACDEALRLIDMYEPPRKPASTVIARDSTGFGCTEAPRGSLYHRYSLSSDGLIREARIVPPTAQNQKSIEEDLKIFADQRAHLPDDELSWQCEQLIRNYDPCISCATHFLEIRRI